MSAAGSICGLRAAAGSIADRGLIEAGQLQPLRDNVAELRAVDWGCWRMRLALWLMKQVESNTEVLRAR